MALGMVAGGALAQGAVSAPGDMITRARDAYNSYRFQDSADIYQSYLEEYPDGPDREEAGFFHGQCLFLLRKLDEADKAFAAEEGANETYADQVLFYRGEIAALERDHSRALVFFDRMISEHPGSMMSVKAKERSGELHFRMGDEYIGQGAYSLALQHYLQAEEAPEELQPRVRYKLGTCYARLGEFTKAIQTWGDLSLEEDDDARAAALLARYRLSRLLEDRGHYSESEVNYQAFIKFNPGHYITPLAEDGLARVWAAQGDTVDAVAYWKERGRHKGLIKSSENFTRAIDHFLHEEYVDAERLLVSIIAEAEDAELLWMAKVWLARLYTQEGRPDSVVHAWREAMSDPKRRNDRVRIECAKAVLEWDPDLAGDMASRVLDQGAGPMTEDALGVSALSLFRKGDPGSRDAADAYLGGHPAGAYAGDIHFTRGKTLMLQGAIGDAESDLEKAAEVHPDPAKKVEALTALAAIYRQEGRLDSAMKALEKAQEAAETVPSPGDALVRERAEISYARGNYKEGLAVYEELCGDTAREDGCSPEDGFRLFWGYYRSGRGEDAAAALDGLSAEGGGWKFKASFWRGMMLMEDGELEGALEVWMDVKPENGIDAGLLAWQAAMVQEQGGAFSEASRTLSLIDARSPEACLFTRGKVLAMALDAGSIEAYQATLPEPSELDKDHLSEEALIKAIREKALAGAGPSELEELNRLLEVESINETAAEEGTLWVAKAGLYTKGRSESMAMLDGIMAADPGTPFVGEIKLYKGEDAFFRKDFLSAVSWLSAVKTEEVPEDLRFRLLYLQGQSYKQLRDYEKMRPYFLALVKDHHEREDAANEWLDVGIGLTLTREFSAAKVALDLAIGQSDQHKLLAEAHYWKGMVLAGSGDSDGALDAFLHVSKNYPRQIMWRVTALNEAADIYVQKEEYDKALELYQRVLDMSQGDRKVTDKVKAKIAEVKKLKRLKNPIIKP
jgi:tetratricopeptide (TPR) repeat protein